MTEPTGEYGTFSQASLEPLDSKQVPRFVGLATFLRSAAVDPWTDIDVPLLGIPIDTGSNRLGTRQGPAQIREMSRFIRRYTSDGNSPFAECRTADVGDAPVNPLNHADSLKKAEGFVAELCERGGRPIAAGGDHSITYPMLAAIAKDEPVGLHQIDSHLDTHVENYGDRLNNGTQIRRAIEDGLVDPRRSIGVGIRGTRFSLDDRDFHASCGMHLMTMDEFDSLGRATAIDQIKSVLGQGRIYVTFDIDGLDTPYCPGTSAPEPGGLSMRDAFAILRSLHGKDVVGADVCEVIPALDPQGETALNAANIMMELAVLAAIATAM
jgi:guanidinopropionase